MIGNGKEDFKSLIVDSNNSLKECVRCHETTRFPRTSFLTHFGVSVAMDNHWQRVVNSVSNSYAVCSKLEKHFICQKREQETFRKGYENRLTTWSGAVNVYKGGLPGLTRCLKIYMFLVVWEQNRGFQLVEQLFSSIYKCRKLEF